MNDRAFDSSQGLPAGTPILIVGLTMAEASEGLRRWPKRDPWIVFAGRLLEPYREGQAFLLRDGPMAGSLTPKGVAETRRHAGAGRDGADLYVLRRTMPDQHGAMIYFVMEDRGTVVEIIEHVGSPAWPLTLFFADDIRRLIRLAFENVHGRII